MENHKITNPYYELYPNLNCAGIVLAKKKKINCYLNNETISYNN
jgi:hypothetical protein